QGSAVAHRIARVRREIEDRLFELGQLDPYARKPFVNSDLDAGLLPRDEPDGGLELVEDMGERYDWRGLARRSERTQHASGESRPLHRCGAELGEIVGRVVAAVTE